MLDEATLTAILELKKNGCGSRKIADALQVSREAVRDVIRSGKKEVPSLERSEAAEPFRDDILELFVRFKGHLGRVHEELVRKGASFSYQALTAFCGQVPIYV